MIQKKENKERPRIGQRGIFIPGSHLPLSLNIFFRRLISRYIPRNNLVLRSV